MTPNTRSADVVVAGAGMGGLVAAARAVESDADVVVLEKGPRPGGTTLVTGGYLVIDDRADPLVDAWEPLEDGVAWLESIGVPVSEPPAAWTEVMATPGTRQVEPGALVDALVDAIEAGDGEILTRTPLRSLRTDDTGAVTGVSASGPDGALTVHADSVVLATGGFAGNPELLERYTGYPAAHVRLRRDPWSTGDGYLAACAAGAATTAGHSILHGHTMPAPPATFGMADYRDATQYYGPRAIAIDEDGRRFVDESEDYEEGALVQGILRAGVERPFLVLDDALYESAWPYVSARSRVENARDFGAPVLDADSLPALGDALDANGVDGERAVATIEAFNDAVARGEGGRLEPPRRDLQYPLDEPPFHAVEVRPGVSFFYGGLDVDHRARVLSRPDSASPIAGHTRDPGDLFLAPIPGLYAAGVEVGRPRDTGYYQDGLSLALATGRIAGAAAAEDATA